MKLKSLWLAALLSASAALHAADHAVVLLYHHVSDDTPASTSISPDQFEAHLDYLDDNGYTVVPLSTVLDSVRDSVPLPDKAVAITFDDAYQSVHSTAWPKLRKREWPFTVFVSTEPIDDGSKGFMTWEQMKEMTMAEFGSHGVGHIHLLAKEDGEGNGEWLERIGGDIDRSVKRIVEAVGAPVSSFAYPYGEYNGDLTELLLERKLYGLAQQSGAVGPGTSLQQVPRYPMDGGTASIKRLKSVLDTRPLPVSSPKVHARFISMKKTPSKFEFTPVEGPYRREDMTCYSSAGGRLEIVRGLASPKGSIEVELPKLKAGRNKINCTAPSTENSGEYFWYTHLWVVRDFEGKWLKH